MLTQTGSSSPNTLSMQQTNKYLERFIGLHAWKGLLVEIPYDLRKLFR